MEASRGRFDPPLENSRVRGLEIPRAKGYHRGKVRLERRNAEVASLQPQPLASECDRWWLVKATVPSSLAKGRRGAIFDQKKKGRPDKGERSNRSEIQVAQSDP